MTVPVEHLVQSWANTSVVRATGPRTLAVQSPSGALVDVGIADAGLGIVELYARWTPSSSTEAEVVTSLAQSTALARGGLLRCVVDGGGVAVVAPVYLEGVTPQSFLSAAAEVAKAYEVLQASGHGKTPEEAAAEQAAAEQAAAEERAAAERAEAERVAAEQAAAEQAAQERAAAERAAAEAAARAAAEQAAAEAAARAAAEQAAQQAAADQAAQQAAADQAAQQAAAQQAAEQAAAQQAAAQAAATQQAQQPAAAPAQGWVASHIVPVGGVAAWNTPDGSVPPAVQLSPGVELQVVERQGDWARVVAQNGWSGWVDGRLLAEAQRG